MLSETSPCRALRRKPRVVTPLLADPVLERIQLRPRQRPRVLRRHLARHRLRDRGTRQPQPPRNLALREPLHEHQPPDLSPLLHAQHPSSSRDPYRSREGQGPAGRRPTAAPPDLVFNRRDCYVRFAPLALMTSATQSDRSLGASDGHLHGDRRVAGRHRNCRDPEEGGRRVMLPVVARMQAERPQGVPFRT